MSETPELKDGKSSDSTQKPKTLVKRILSSKAFKIVAGVIGAIIVYDVLFSGGSGGGGSGGGVVDEDNSTVLNVAEMPVIEKDMFGIRLGEGVEQFKNRMKTAGVSVTESPKSILGMKSVYKTFMTFGSMVDGDKGPVLVEKFTMDKSPTGDAIAKSITVYAYQDKVYGIVIDYQQGESDVLAAVARAYPDAEPVDPEALPDGSAGEKWNRNLARGYMFRTKISGQWITIAAEFLNGHKLTYAYEKIRLETLFAVERDAAKPEKADRDKLDKTNF